MENFDRSSIASEKNCSQLLQFSRSAAYLSSQIYLLSARFGKARIQLKLPTATSVSLSVAAQVAAAVQRQITEDFTPWWGIPGNVVAFGSLEDVPQGYFVIQLVGSLTQPGIEGFHYLDQLGEPHALVRVDH